MEGLCRKDCEHLRSFRKGFNGVRVMAPYNGTDAKAVCALRPEKVLSMRGYPECVGFLSDGE